MSKHKITAGFVGVEYIEETTGKSRTTISRMIRENRLPEPYQDGRRIVWEKNEIDCWIKNKKHMIY